MVSKNSTTVTCGPKRRAGQNHAPCKLAIAVTILKRQSKLVLDWLSLLVHC